VRSLGADMSSDYSGLPASSQTVSENDDQTITVNGLDTDSDDEELEVFEISIASETITSGETINVNPRKALVFLKNTPRKPSVFLFIIPLIKFAAFSAFKTSVSDLNSL